MRILIGMTAAVFLLGACGGSDNGDNTAPPPAQTVRAAGVIDQLEVVSTVDAYGGATPSGASGPYSVITGIVHGKLDPTNADNAGIVDLASAPVGTDGYVSYTTDVVILRPKSASTARRVLFYDVVNRGNKLGQGSFVGGGAFTGGAAPDATFPSLLRAGYTVVWSGWQSGIAQSGAGATQSIGVKFPVATNRDGTSITGLSREEFIADYAGGTTIPLTYAPASLTDRSEVTFTARQSWLNSAGKEDYQAPSVPVATWSYVTNPDNSISVQFTAPTTVPGPNGTNVAADAGTIYSFVYRAKDPTVNGIGFAAVRDLIAFLKNASTDARGTANPLNDMKSATCAAGTGCAAGPTTNFDVALGEGISQSGRYLRDFLYQGFNKDGNGKAVFDGLMPIISAGRRTWTNVRFAQGGRWSKQHEDHFMPGDQFPFAYNVLTDPVSGASDGLLKSCTTSATCPKIMQIDGAFEWWGGRASLVVTDGAGRDIVLPDNVRYYLVSGTQHGGGAGVTTGIVTQPAAGSLCQFAPSPVSETPVERALIPALENWVVRNTAPPVSQYPTVAAGTLVPTDRTSTGFPNLASVVVPSGAAAMPTSLSLNYSGIYNQLFVTNYANAVPVVDLTRQYAVLVPKVDSNGNETSGILMPELSVPLATYMGWNLRGTGHAVGEGCSSTGSAIPFAVSPALRAATDPRRSVADLYSGRTDYQTKFAAATDTLVARGYLTAVDATTIYKNGSLSVSPTLIPNP
ncbi:MAG: alpha/beta hydrolase domain-containing protein [Burkholderiaceae bacterium]